VCNSAKKSTHSNSVKNDNSEIVKIVQTANACSDYIVEIVRNGINKAISMWRAY
jgi:hypothetical protein